MKLCDDVIALIMGAVAILFRAVFWTQDGFMNIDSYTYAQVARDGMPRDYSMLSFIAAKLGLVGTEVLLIVLVGFTSYFFYKLCRRYTNQINAALATVMFSLSPLVFFNNQFGIFDKNVYSLFMIVVIMLVMTLNYEWKTLLLLPLLALFTVMWKGAAVMWLIVVVYGLFTLIKQKKLMYAYCLFALSVLGFIIGKVPARWKSLAGGTYFGIEKELIGETRYIWNVPFFNEFVLFGAVIIFLIFIYYTADTLRDNKYSFSMMMLWITVFLSSYMFRWLIYFLPVFYLHIALIFDWEDNLALTKIKPVTWSIVGVFIVVFMLSFNQIYLRESMENPALRAAIDHTNTLDGDCIIADWGKGHILDYYSSKQVLYMATAGEISQQVAFMVYGKDTNCTILYEYPRDQLTMSFMLTVLEMENSTPYYVDTVLNDAVSFKHENKTYWVIE